jgi:hypothetical protein
MVTLMRTDGHGFTKDAMDAMSTDDINKKYYRAVFQTQFYLEVATASAENGTCPSALLLLEG